MTMQHRGRGFQGAQPIVIREEAYRKQDRAIRTERIRIDSIGMACRKIADDYPDSAAWFCLQVRPRAETAVEELLCDVNVQAIVPRYNAGTVKRRGRLMVANHLPAMPGFILVRCVYSPAAVQGLLNFDRQKRVVGIVGHPENPHKIKHEIVEKFVNDLGNGRFDVRPKEHASFNCGERVRIVDGPFTGFSGEVVAKCHDPNRMKVEANLFGRLVEVELDVAQVKKV